MSYFYSILLAQINNSTPEPEPVLNWNTYNCPIGKWKSVACAASGKYVAIADGTTFSYDEITNLTYTKVMYSTDGMVWTLSSIELNINSRNIAFNNGKFVIFGTRFNSNLYRFDKILYISDDGINWTTTKVLDFNGSYEKVCSVNGIFFVLPSSGSGLFYTSSDGITWSTHYIQSNVLENMYPIDITYFNGKYLLLGQYGKCAYCTNDFNSWTTFNITPTATGNWTIIEAVKNNKVFTLSSSTQTAQSLDGNTWTYQSQSNADFEFGEFGTLMSGYFVGGNQFEILYSADGLTNYISIPKDSTLIYITAVCHSNDKFVVVGSGDGFFGRQVVYVLQPA